MLKLHKGLKKKKKDKKHKRKEEELFNEEELEKYRKEHQSVPGDSETVSNSVQSAEWQKFKALTEGVDTILQKTQEDLDRIKSTSFFQRKATASEVEREKEEERKLEEEKLHESEAQNAASESHEQGDEHVEKSESEDESEEPVDDTLFDTSYVDAVASGELKLAYIPDSPDKEEEDFDPFDTSIADKFVETNPRKRYLNLGCAVQVLSGKGAGDKQNVPVGLEKKSPRRRVKPVDLLLTSFDEDSRPDQEILKEKTPSESPVKNLLDEDDPTFEKADIDIFSLPPAPVLPVPTPTVVPESKQEKEKLDLSEFELNDLSPIPCVNTALEKQPSSESTDDEFAQLAAESLAKKVSLTPAETQNSFQTEIKSFDQISPTESISVNPLEPQTITEEAEVEIDPFDTSIVEKLILPGKQEIKLLEKELLTDVPPPSTVVDDIDDDDFDPRAGETPVKVIRPQNLEIVLPVQQPVFDKTPSQRQDFLKIEEHETEIEKPLTPLTENCEKVDEDFDPFDTSRVCGAPGKSELKLIEKELIHKADSLEDDDFDPRKFESENQSNSISITDTILNKYACNVNEPKQQEVEPAAVDILTGEDHSAEIPHSPVEPEKFVINSPELEYVDPFDTSIADNIQPGKVELKLLETELISKN